MGHAQRILPNYTYEDYLHWEGRWELIDGIPFAMSPLPSPRDQRVAAAMGYEFENAIRNTGCNKCRLYQPLDFKVAEDTIVQPDVLIVCGKIGKNYLDFPPTLVVEILSPATALRDRHTKYEIYQAQGVKYYLIVDAEKETIEIYVWRAGKYELQPMENSFNFQLDADCQIEVSFAEIWN